MHAAAETRVLTRTVELRATGDGSNVATGYAAVFNRSSEDLGGFTESVAPGAFDKTLREADVVALWNHDEQDLLGRTSARTLRLATDDVGLRYEIDLPDTTAGRDLGVLLERGDVRGSSFAFRTIADVWEEDEESIHRTLKEVQLYDVSPVTRPAYPDTTSALRSLAQRHDLDLEDLLDAQRRGELRSLLVPSGGDGPGGGSDDDGRGSTVVRPSLLHLYA